jgi:hypothetical protein
MEPLPRHNRQPPTTNINDDDVALPPRHQHPLATPTTMTWQVPTPTPMPDTNANTNTRR